MALDPRPGGAAKYRQIADELRRLILGGELPPGASLPSAEELGERYGATRPTVQAALRLLRAAGLLDTSPGRPATVRARPPITRVQRPTPRDWAVAADGQEEVTEVGYRPAPEHVADELGIDRTARAFVRRSLFASASGRPVRLESTWLPPELATGARLFQPEPLHVPAHLAAETGRQPASGRTLTGARMPTPEEAAALDVPDGVPLLYVLVLEYDPDNTPLYVTELGWPADRYELADDYPTLHARQASTQPGATPAAARGSLTPA